MLLIKDKLNDNLLKTRKKAQILTMAPDWTRARIAEYLDVSEYMVHEARKLAREKGILALPEPKRDKCLWKEVEDSLKLFYEDDEYSQLVPGAKDYVSVARNFHQQNICYSLTWGSYTSHTRRSFPNTRLSCQSFVNSDLSGTLQSSHPVLILYVCGLST